MNFLDHYEPVPESGCWLWSGKVNRNGYGIYRDARAHRLFYEASFGPIPDGMFVCHKCDTPLCVNPSHLFAGTYVDNHDDMRRKSRQAMGASHGRSKLSAEQVNQIRELLALGFSHSEIAKKYGVSRPTVSFISSGKRWGGGKFGKGDRSARHKRALKVLL